MRNRYLRVCWFVKDSKRKGKLRIEYEERDGRESST